MDTSCCSPYGFSIFSVKDYGVGCEAAIQGCPGSLCWVSEAFRLSYRSQIVPTRKVSLSCPGELDQTPNE